MNNNGLSDLIIEALTVADSAVFCGSSANGVYISVDHSSSWAAFNTGLGDLNIRALATGSGYIFAGTFYNGIWRRALTDIASGQDIVKSNETELHVFPNPFSSELTFILSDNKPATVVLYDFLRQQIFTEIFTKSTTINTEQLRGSIYVYEIRNDKGLKCGKILKQ